MEFSLIGREIQWIQAFWKIAEAWIGLNLKHLFLTHVLLALLSQYGFLHKSLQVWIILPLKNIFTVRNEVAAR